MAVYASPDHFSDLPFHLKRRVMVVGSDRGTIGEQVRDPKNAPSSAGWFPETADFAKLFNGAEKRVYCLVDEGDLHELTDAGLKDPVVVEESFGRTLISNRGSGF